MDWVLLIGRTHLVSEVLPRQPHTRRGGEPPRVDVACLYAVLEVVHRVGDVVRPVHDLRLDATRASGGAVTGPLEDRGVVVVHAELRSPLLSVPWVLGRRVQRRSGEVEPRTDLATLAGGSDDLRLQPGQHAQALRVAFEAAARRREVRERGLAVVTERRVTEVVREARGVDEVRVGAECRRELATDLRALERVRQPGAWEVALAVADDLGLGGEPAQSSRVQHP